MLAIFKEGGIDAPTFSFCPAEDITWDYFITVQDEAPWALKSTTVPWHSSVYRNSLPWMKAWSRCRVMNGWVPPSASSMSVFWSNGPKMGSWKLATSCSVACNWLFSCRGCINLQLFGVWAKNLPPPPTHLTPKPLTNTIFKGPGVVIPLMFPNLP